MNIPLLPQFPQLADFYFLSWRILYLWQSVSELKEGFGILIGIAMENIKLCHLCICSLVKMVISGFDLHKTVNSS